MPDELPAAAFVAVRHFQLDLRTLSNSFELSMAPTKQPQLGSLAIQAPIQPPQIVHVSASTCHDLSLFKGTKPMTFVSR